MSSCGVSERDGKIRECENDDDISKKDSVEMNGLEVFDERCE